MDGRREDVGRVIRSDPIGSGRVGSISFVYRTAEISYNWDRIHLVVQKVQ